MNNTVLTKSIFNYIGGKYKYLPELLSIFPRDVDMFYDVFGGGFNVGLNVKANKIVFNDIVPYVLNVFKELKNVDTNDALEEIHEIINTYEISKTNEEGFKKLRDDYNAGFKTWASFYVLVCCSFNNQYRFNNKHEYNSSFRKNRIPYSDVTEKKFINFMDRLHSIDVEFHNKDFKEIDYSLIKQDDFVYFDPPYIITTANYNDGKRGFEGWTIDDELYLYELCDKLNMNNVRFALTNMTHHKGKENNALIEWSSNYKVHTLDYKCQNFNHNKIGQETTREVLITNY